MSRNRISWPVPRVCWELIFAMTIFATSTMRLATAADDPTAPTLMALQENPARTQRDAFTVTPAIRSLNATEDEPPAFCEGSSCYSAVFNAPCHFPQPASMCGVSESGNTENVVIYEGMTLAVAADGRYQLSMIVEVPRMPITLKLQLHVDLPGEHPGTITMAPISIDGSTNPHRHQSSHSYRVVYRGYSRLLKNQSGTIRRTGSVRYGSTPEHNDGYSASFTSSNY